ncbi:MAG: TlpA family protein disulfide reductase [Rhodoferax sp.]|uniref:TlpA family protein disulfide reductase n=1 Tax=Rhodoferax sp. TaxID=50421 RepID=UPI001B7CB0B2|nr:TlpA disulfide reductase family protein [Rhodoferax sp.]MBP9905846.1 TlpA family protein disulfide reductase [Rhodoferax sp.]
MTTRFCLGLLACFLAWTSSGVGAQPVGTSVTTSSVAVSAQPISARALFSINLFDLDNQPASLANRQGQPMVVNFWARWCPPCRVEIPELVALQSRKTGVVVIGLNIETDPAPVRDFAYAYDINYPVLLTRTAGLDLMRALGNSKAGLPFTVVLNRQGDIVASHTGVVTKAQLDAAVALALR